jgi:ABC-2 type transport system permease protein
MNTLRMSRPAAGFIFGMFLLPLPMLFFARFIIPEGIAVGPRLLVGAMVFTTGLNAVNMLANGLISDRFTYRLALIRARPIHPFAYAAAMMLTSAGQAVVNASALLIFAPIFGIDIDFSLWFFPVIMLTAVSLTGIALIIGTWSPSWELGNRIASIAGIFIVLMSPIYFPISRLPDWLQVPAHFSPYTYAANALDAILSGRSDFGSDIAILAGITAVGVAVGAAGMRWREV